MKSGFPLVPVLLAFLLALAGCGPAPFSDLIGVNLINGVDFSDPGWVADQIAPYMSFQSDGTTYDGSPGYRLEINNLFTNGDFQIPVTTGTPPPNWTVNGLYGASDTCTVVSVPPLINGNTMSFSIISPQDWISFDLDAGSTDVLQVGNTYLLRFSFIANVNPVAFSYNEGTVDVKVWPIPTVPGSLSFFPPLQYPPDSSFLVRTSAQHYLSINTVIPLTDVPAPTGQIDNIRMLRADIPCRIRYKVPFSRSGRPDLVPGTYVFFVYVKTDPSVSPVTPNRFPATGISIAVDAAVNGTFTYGTQVAVAHPTDTGADWSQWTLVKGSFSATSIPSSSLPNAPMLQLSITPTDVTYSLGKEDIGSILIAVPRLEFVP